MFKLYQGRLVWSVLVYLTTKQALARSDWNQQTRDYIVNIHNTKRAAEDGCHINKLVYDIELEKHAKQWALGCRFNREKNKDRGENLACFLNSKIEEKQLLKKTSDIWLGQKKNYSYGQNSCTTTSTCSYTQMVWGNTNRIGCYSTHCPYLEKVGQNAWFIVCFYTPVGNVEGENPYEKECTSQCQEGQTEDNGLCVGEVKRGNGECVNEHGNCNQWAKLGQCNAYTSYMNVKCPKSCQTCNSTESGEVQRG